MGKLPLGTTRDVYAPLSRLPQDARLHFDVTVDRAPAASAAVWSATGDNAVDAAAESAQ